MNTNQVAANSEQVGKALNGWLMLPLFMGLLLITIALSITEAMPRAFLFVLLPVFIVLLLGFFTLQPNEARVLVLFGAYKGTVRKSGFHWGNPFYTNGLRLGHVTQSVGGQHKSADMSASGTNRKS